MKSEAASGLSWSAQIWGLEWAQELPRMMSRGIRVEYKRYAEAMPLIKSLFPDVYGSNEQTQAFFDSSDASFKQRYYEVAGDYFAFYDSEKGGRLIGMAACTILDWAGYNFRSISIHPEYQQYGIYPEFFELLCEVLTAHGISRIEGDLSPTNRHHLGALAKMGYVVTGMNISERWGALTHVTKYLSGAEEDRFCDLFSGTSISDKASNRRFQKKVGAA